MSHPAPSFNHVAMSVPADLLAEKGRGELTRFYRDVFGFEELPTETIDRKRLVLAAGKVDQFLFLIAGDEPMTCPRLDHWGMSVPSEAQLDDYLERAKRFRDDDPRVDIVDKHVADHRMLSITSFYVAYLLPMMVEVQYWEFKPSDADAGADAGADADAAAVS